MNIEDAIRSRSSIRAFTDKPVSRETVTRILDMAQRAPSGTNTQPWHVHVAAGPVRDAITAEAYAQFADHYFRLHQAAVDAAEERRAQHAERQSRADAPQPSIEEEAKPQPDTEGDSAAEKADDGAEVVDLSPAKLSEMVQEEQDSASA